MEPTLLRSERWHNFTLDVLSSAFKPVAHPFQGCKRRISTIERRMTLSSLTANWFDLHHASPATMQLLRL